MGYQVHRNPELPKMAPVRPPQGGASSLLPTQQLQETLYGGNGHFTRQDLGPP